MNARKEVAAYLKKALGTSWKIVPEPRPITQLEAGKKAVIFWRESLEYLPAAPGSDTYLARFTLWLVMPNADVREDTFDGWLDELLEAIADHDQLIIETATRDVYSDAAHGWRITLTAATTAN